MALPFRVCGVYPGPQALEAKRAALRLILCLVATGLVSLRPSKSDVDDMLMVLLVLLSF